MVQYAVVLDRNFTSKFSPYFEIIYSAEFFTILTDLLLSPTLAWIIWNAQPLHRNLRYSLIYCIFHLFLINASRIPLLWAQQFVDDWDDYHAFLSIVSFIRFETYCFAMWIILGVTIERLVATQYWSWYEKQERDTLYVIVAILSTMEFIAVIITYHILNQDVLYTTDTIKILRTVSIVVGVGSISAGFVGYFALLYYNNRELRKLSRRADPDFDKYSLARTYQLRENVIIMKMIVRIIVPTFVFASPIALFRAALFMLMDNPDNDFYSYMLVAVSDVWMALSCLNIQLIFPFFDYRFRKPAMRIGIFRRIIEMKGMQNTTVKFERKHLIARESLSQATADHYFNWLEKDLK